MIRSKCLSGFVPIVYRFFFRLKALFPTSISFNTFSDSFLNIQPHIFQQIPLVHLQRQHVICVLLAALLRDRRLQDAPDRYLEPAEQTGTVQPSRFLRAPPRQTIQGPDEDAGSGASQAARV